MPPLAGTTDADQVVGGKDPAHPSLNLGQRDQRQFAQRADCLRPAKALFAVLAHLLTERVVLAGRCAPTHRARPLA